MNILKIRNPKHEIRNKNQMLKNLKIQILDWFQHSDFGIRISLQIILFLSLIFSSNLFAAQYDIKEMTPEIEQALQNRQARYSQIQQMKGGGVLGEDNQGYVKVLKQLPDADAIASQENADRRTIYKAIVSQNGLGSEGLAAVQKVFAEVQREKAAGGDSIQLPSGDWVQK